MAEPQKSYPFRLSGVPIAGFIPLPRELPPPPGLQRGQCQMGKVRFYGEVDGPRERELKQQLSVYFASDWLVTAAYFARFGEWNDPPKLAGLCVKFLVDQHREQSQINQKIGDIYASIFRQEGDKMDIIHLTEDAEIQVARFCSPFYVKKNRLDRPDREKFAKQRYYPDLNMGDISFFHAQDSPEALEQYLNGQHVPGRNGRNGHHPSSNGNGNGNGNGQHPPSTRKLPEPRHPRWRDII
jgi:hypothetical protein